MTYDFAAQCSMSTYNYDKMFCKNGKQYSTMMGFELATRKKYGTVLYALNKAMFKTKAKG